MHGRTEARRPAFNLFTRSGSASNWRPIETKSQSPAAIISSATSGNTRPTAITGIVTYFFTVRAKSRYWPTSDGNGPSVKSRNGLWALADTWIASAPASSMRAAARAVSSGVSPFSRPYSNELRRTITGKSGPTSALTARTTSHANRARFSSDPPHRSVRLL